MIHPVSSSTQTQATAQPKAAPQQAAKPQPQPAQAKPQTTPADKVTLSAAKQIAQEAVETSAQTTKEAAGGDIQAKRLLAKEAAAHASIK